MKPPRDIWKWVVSSLDNEPDAWHRDDVEEKIPFWIYNDTVGCRIWTANERYGLRIEFTDPKIEFGGVDSVTVFQIWRYKVYAAAMRWLTRGKDDGIDELTQRLSKLRANLYLGAK